METTTLSWKTKVYREKQLTFQKFFTEVREYSFWQLPPCSGVFEFFVKHSLHFVSLGWASVSWADFLAKFSFFVKLQNTHNTFLLSWEVFQSFEQVSIDALCVIQATGIKN